MPVCFTMLHHVPSKALQDKLFTEVCRVLRPGGVFAGFDSQLSLRFRFLHLGDTMVVVDPKTFPDRLRAAGFTGGARRARTEIARPVPRPQAVREFPGADLCVQVPRVRRRVRGVPADE
jgi:SAM-dependent methyltransferase